MCRKDIKYGNCNICQSSQFTEQIKYVFTVKLNRHNKTSNSLQVQKLFISDHCYIPFDVKIKTLLLHHISRSSCKPPSIPQGCPVGTDNRLLPYKELETAHDLKTCRSQIPHAVTSHPLLIETMRT